MLQSRQALLVFLALTLTACGGDDTMMVTPDSGPVASPAQVASIVAFEGMERMVNSLEVVGVDLTGATVSIAEGSGLELLESRCNNARCGVILRIPDLQGNRGIGIPAPIDAVNAFVNVTDARGVSHRGLITIRPLDTISNGGTSALTISQSMVFAASGMSVATSSFIAGPADAPIRWLVFGPADLHGGFDVGPQDGGQRAGGRPGGAIGAAGQGAGGGGAGAAGSGGGGGGHGEAGNAGTDASGTAELGGVAGVVAGDGVATCLTTFDQTGCGGSGGGGSDAGAGGPGGGALLLLSLGHLDLSEASITAVGGDGLGAGGGGAGGQIFIAARSWTAPAGLDVAGGLGASSGGATGGDGGPGRLRVDVYGERPDGAYIGPTVDLSSLALLTSEGTAMLVGQAMPDATIDVSQVAGSSVATGMADAAGDFTIDVPLAAGLNRLVVRATTPEGTARTWTGTSIEFESFSGIPMPLPAGAAIDISYVPAAE